MLLLAALLAVAPVYACTVEQQHNESTGETVTIPVEALRHPLGTLTLSGDHYTRDQLIEHPDGSDDYAHWIDRATGRFSSTLFRTSHAAGEQYLIRLSGHCTLPG